MIAVDLKFEKMLSGHYVATTTVIDIPVLVCKTEDKGDWLAIPAVCKLRPVTESKYYEGLSKGPYRLDYAYAKTRKQACLDCIGMMLDTKQSR